MFFLYKDFGINRLSIGVQSLQPELLKFLTRIHDRKKVFDKMKEADIGFRIITGGSILRHDVKNFFDYEVVKELKNANTAHDYGFFVGNHPFELKQQLNKLAEVLNIACQ